jgi:hypothetical protein
MADDARVLTRRRLLVRTLVGIAGRGSQGLLLGGSILILDPDQSSDLAVVLTGCAVMNLVSNAGLPTLFVKNGRNGAIRGEMLGLARAYVLFTISAAVALFPFILILTHSEPLALTASTLLFLQSAYTGYEYWSLGGGNLPYDAFLRRGAAPQAAMSLLAPMTLFLARSSSAGLLVLALSYLLPLLNLWGRRNLWQRAKEIWPHDLRVSGWAVNAAAVGYSTIASALFYGADVFVLRASATPDVVANYKLAITCVSFVVGLLPLSLFLLADVAAGLRTNWRGVAVLVCSAVSIVLVAGSIAGTVSPRFDLLGNALRYVAPLAAARILSQVMSSELHGRGRHRAVARAYTTGVAGWVIIAALTVTHRTTVQGMATYQGALEVVVVTILIRQRFVATRATAGPKAEVGCA